MIVLSVRVVRLIISSLNTKRMSVSRWRSTNQQTLRFLHNPTCFKSQKLLMRLVCRIAITKRFSGLSYLLYMWIPDSPHFPCAVFLGSNLHCISNLMTSLLLFYADELRSSKTITLKMVLLLCFFFFLLDSLHFKADFMSFSISRSIAFYFTQINVTPSETLHDKWFGKWLDGFHAFLKQIFNLIYWLQHAIKIFII